MVAGLGFEPRKAKPADFLPEAGPPMAGQSALGELAQSIFEPDSPLTRFEELFSFERFRIGLAVLKIDEIQWTPIFSAGGPTGPVILKPFAEIAASPLVEVFGVTAHQDISGRMLGCLFYGGVEVHIERKPRLFGA
jgi:hypothetical protein